MRSAIEGALFICHVFCFFFQAEDGIRDAQESRGLGDVYKRQALTLQPTAFLHSLNPEGKQELFEPAATSIVIMVPCLLYTSDAADDLLCVDLGGRRIIKKKKQHRAPCTTYTA